MRRLTLFAIPLVFVVVGISRAQQPSNPVQETPPSGATAMSPRDAAEMRADIMMARKEFVEAIGAYRDLLKTEPKNAQLLNKIGVACQQLDDLRCSDRSYKKAMQADKGFSSPVNNLGTVEYQKRHYGKAINLYKKALGLNADLPTIYSNLGYAYFANKEYPEAMDSFGKALALDPKVFEHKGGSGSLIQQRTSTDPGLLFFLLAKTYAETGDAERTAHCLKVARDDGYKDYRSAEKDPAFAKVIKDPRVQEVLHTKPPYVGEPAKPTSN
jgi:tetratricopeptide (TPR) repeat protein